MGRSYEDYIARRKAEAGRKFSDSDLAKKFIPYYESQQRIKVMTPWGKEMTGTVGATTGWRPAFLLMSRSNAIGSSTVLDNKFKIIGVQVGGKYIKVGRK